MVLMVVCWRYRMPFDANGCVSTLVSVDWIKWIYFCVSEFEVGANDSIISGNEQQTVYFTPANAYLFLVRLTPDRRSSRETVEAQGIKIRSWKDNVNTLRENAANWTA